MIRSNRTERWLLVLCGLLFACGSGPPAGILPPPSIEELGLTEKERESYAPITFDNFFHALEIAGDDREALEVVIKRVKRKTVGWSGVVQGSRVVKKGFEISEFSLSVAPPSQASSIFPKTVPVLITAPNDDPVTELEKGTPIVFVGRLEFDGFSREPWVMDSRLITITARE